MKEKDFEKYINKIYSENRITEEEYQVLTDYVYSLNDCIYEFDHSYNEII